MPPEESTKHWSLVDPEQQNWKNKTVSSPLAHTIVLVVKKINLLWAIHRDIRKTREQGCARDMNDAISHVFQKLITEDSCQFLLFYKKSRET